MRRREFITLLGGAAATWPIAARAQQAAMPVIGFLEPATLEADADHIAGFLQGLKENGFVDGDNVHIEYRVAAGVLEKLPALAMELVSLRPSVIFAVGGASALAAKRATSAIPVVFGMAADPVSSGVVSSLRLPTGNLTGVATFASALGAKQLELLRELSNPRVIAVLVVEGAYSTESQVLALKTAAETLSQELLFFNARTAQEIDTAFDSLVARRANALLVTNNAVLSTHREQISALALRHRLPAVYPQREYIKLGGLISYDTNLREIYRHAGVYTGRILKGEKPGDLPVMQPTKFELVVNLKTAKALGLEIPPTLLALADEVIE